MAPAPEAHEFRPFDPEAENPVELVWPRMLLLPVRPPLLGYLDLNHWIGMAKAAVGHPDGNRYAGALDAARRARSAGRVVFPLSGTHYQEIAKLRDEHRRRDLALIMEELSGFTTLVSRFVVMQLELDTLLDDNVGPNPVPIEPVQLLGYGVGHSVGRRGDLRVVGADGADVTDQVRLQVGAAEFDAFVSQANLELERGVLAGPQDSATTAELRASGWQPDAALKVAQERADQESRQAALLDTDLDWCRGRLRDVISANEFAIELVMPFLDGLLARGGSLEGMFPDRPSCRRFMRSMPSSEVAVEMKTHYHRNRETRWDARTIFDIDAMALAVPYCDAVVTENHACATLVRAGFEDRMGTVLMRRPDELEAWLSQVM